MVAKLGERALVSDRILWTAALNDTVRCWLFPADAIETLLVLLYRHFGFYLSLPAQAPTSRYEPDSFLRGSRAPSARGASQALESTAEKGVLAREATEAVAPIVERLAGLALVSKLCNNGYCVDKNA